MPDKIDDLPSPDHAAQAADHVMALVAAADPTFRVTSEQQDTMVGLILAIVRAVSRGRAR